jgi:hypothetical protein
METGCLIGVREVALYPDDVSRRHLKVPAAIDTDAQSEVVEILLGALLLLPKCQRIRVARGRNRKRNGDRRRSDGRRRHIRVNGIESGAEANAKVRTGPIQVWHWRRRPDIQM